MIWVTFSIHYLDFGKLLLLFTLRKLFAASCRASLSVSIE